jgi:hypothetical protein
MGVSVMLDGDRRQQRETNLFDGGGIKGPRVRCESAEMVFGLDTREAGVGAPCETAVVKAGGPYLVLFELLAGDVGFQQHDVVVGYNGAGLDGDCATGSRVDWKREREGKDRCSCSGEERYESDHDEIMNEEVSGAVELRNEVKERLAWKRECVRRRRVQDPDPDVSEASCEVEDVAIDGWGRRVFIE